MKKHLVAIIALLTLLTGLTLHVSAEVESVLSVVPEEAVGLIYLPSLLGLNAEINALLSEMVPSDPPQELIAGLLAETFGAGFETLAELEELGFDFNKDFAIFLASVMPPVPSAVVHIKDPQQVKQLIESEAEGSTSGTHNGVTYHMTGEEGAFVILDDVMVYSRSPEVCKKAIDTHKKTIPSIAKNRDYASFKLDVSSGVNDVVAYFAADQIVTAVKPLLMDGAEKMKAGMAEQAETNPQLTSGLEMSRNVIDAGFSFLDQAKSLSLTLQLNGSDLQLSPFLKFKDGSDIQNVLRMGPRELSDLKYLPKTAFINMGLQMKSEDFLKFFTNMKWFTPQNPNADAQALEAAFKEYTKLIQNFAASVSDEFAMSVNFSESIMPDSFSIVNLTDEKKMKNFMEKDYLKLLKATDGIYQAMELDVASAFQNATEGASEVYKGVEIKSYSLPNFGQMFNQLPPEVGTLAPKQGNVFYAITSGKLLFAMASNANQIKQSLDRIGGTGPGFDEGVGYDKLTGTLPEKNNLLLAISPVTAVKNLVTLFAQMDPNIGMMQMFLANIPETYSIGIASQNQEGGVNAQLFIPLADFKEIITMVASLQNMQ